MVQDLTIEDLSKRSGLSLRTLRYYIQESLLPGPDTAGKYASYSQQHLDHLAIIQRLKALHLPLKEIRHLLSNMTPEGMGQILEYQDLLNSNLLKNKKSVYQVSSTPAGNSSAMEYIHDLERRHKRLRSLGDSPSTPKSLQQKHKGQSESSSLQESTQNYQTAQERWTKIILSNGIELNIKEKQVEENKAKINALIKFTAQLFVSKSKGESKK